MSSNSNNIMDSSDDYNLMVSLNSREIIDLLNKDRRSITISDLTEDMGGQENLIKELGKNDLAFDQDPQTVKDYLVSLLLPINSISRILKGCYMAYITMNDIKTSSMFILQLQNFIEANGIMPVIKEILDKYNNVTVYVTYLLESNRILAESIFDYNHNNLTKIKFMETQTIKYYLYGNEEYKPLKCFISELRQIYGYIKKMSDILIKERVFIYIKFDNLEIFKYFVDIKIKPENINEHKDFFMEILRMSIICGCHTILRYIITSKYIDITELQKGYNIKLMFENYNVETFNIFKEVNKWTSTFCNEGSIITLIYKVAGMQIKKHLSVLHSEGNDNINSDLGPVSENDPMPNLIFNKMFNDGIINKENVKILLNAIKGNFNIYYYRGFQYMVDIHNKLYPEEKMAYNGQPMNQLIRKNNTIPQIDF